jgi:hypothetical protein
MSQWQEVLRAPRDGDHIVQLYQDDESLAASVAEFAGTALESGHAAILIARPEHGQAFLGALGARHVDVVEAMRRRQLTLLDAETTLTRFLEDGEPQWTPFHEVVGGAIAEARLRFPVVRAYGEMVDILWQRGERDAAIRLEEFWKELAGLQTFSLFCAYYLDNLDSASYAALDCISKAHSHLIPARDCEKFDEDVSRASENVLEQPLARMLLSMYAVDRTATKMPAGQAILLWLQKNMPVTAERVLAEMRARR